MQFGKLALIVFASAAFACAQDHQLKTVEEVLERYQQALGGADAIQKVQSETRHGEVESPGMKGKVTFVSYAKPFKYLGKTTRPDGTQVTSGFDGKISWTIDGKGASIDKTTPVESDRRDSDLQYPLHEADYFSKYEFAGVTDFEGRRCYWLHGTTHWGKDNNQFYDAETGLLAGYRFQADSSNSSAVITALFQDYKKFGGPPVATRNVTRLGDQSQTVTFTSVSYEPLPDSMFELPAAVKALIK